MTQMTAVIDRPAPVVRSPATFLRRALAADAVTSGAAGLLMTFGAGALEGPLGLPAPLLQVAGLILLPFAAGVAYLAARAMPPRPAVWAVIALNAVWALDSGLLLVSGWVAPTALGYAFVIVQAAAVAAFAEIQYVGLRRSTARAA
jgi:hypothetical protein